ncbi:iron export ABC transporter permease subunit FetB [Sporanaerobium hydrogeniformans]|uniref:Iron export ABC transporter permease subunit FetB n=1 Tax=Sporanaerobium hydrogeniformans TaxID=3072179 RepID=A0AC61DAK8_9FIRM|nr:iron export ABC transporter permease subunit FetB [Sporanaerobium hydrogeniformans]PHV70047.1 iron export ABC transporter permease subunit FetB [Sporanaerobium hydrogeniformans]
MQGIIQLNLLQFGTVYLLLLIVLAIMKKSKINQTKLLLVASLRMTVQLVIAGLLLTYIFQNPHPLFTVLYLCAMVTFAIHRVLSRHKDMNPKFKLAIALSLAGSGLSILFFFIGFIVRMDLFTPQYTIPLSGMIMGNAMTGVSLGLKTFNESLRTQKPKIDTLLNLGVSPKKILIPFVNNALETALLPTLNSMLGMGIISLPGMMTGQILSGTLPTIAILYQIAIMIAICTVVCLSVFCSLYFGYRTLYNKHQQISF